MQQTAVVAAIAALVLVPGCGGGSDGDNKAAAPGDQPGAAERAERAVEGSQRDSDGDGVLDLYDEDPNKAKATPDPKGSFEAKCDYLLGDSTEGPSGYKLVAGGTLENTGNVGIVAVIKATWTMLGGEPVTGQKKVRLRAGRTKDVQLAVQATPAQIDAHQAADGKCKTGVSIADTFGEVKD